MIEIKKRFTGEVIHSGYFETVKEAVIDAVKRGANLSGANLWYTNLRGANLSGTNLSNVNLRNANLSGANLWGADLRGADLSGANLSDADLWNANLRNANLSDVNLSDAELWYADLSGANLRGANLRDANLNNANLRGANLWGCSGNRSQIKSLSISDIYSITYTSERLQIGCENHAIKDWWTFDDERIKEMDGSKAVEFWAEHKEFIKLAIEKYPATPTKEQAE